MIFLKCKVCDGEVEFSSEDRTVNKKTKCTQCGISNGGEVGKRKTEVIIVRKSNK